MASLALPTPAQRTAPPATVARVCLNGHLADAAVAPRLAADAPTNRADPLAVATTGVTCAECAAGTILACPGCGYAILGGSDWDLAAQILAVVLPADRRAGLDLRGTFSA